MKKFLLTTILFFLLAGLNGCGSKPATPAEEEAFQKIVATAEKGDLITTKNGRVVVVSRPHWGGGIRIKEFLYSGEDVGIEARNSRYYFNENSIVVKPSDTATYTKLANTFFTSGKI
jgi:hypothetical protein